MEFRQLPRLAGARRSILQSRNGAGRLGTAADGGDDGDERGRRSEPRNPTNQFTPSFTFFELYYLLLFTYLFSRSRQTFNIQHQPTPSSSQPFSNSISIYMPLKRSRSRSAAAQAAATGGRPVTVAQDPSPSPKRVKVSADSLGGTQRKLDAFFTSPKKPTSQSAAATVKRRDSTRHLGQPEVIVIDDEQGEQHPSTSTRPPSQHSNERRPAAGNASDCGAGPVIIPATPMEEEVRLGVRRKYQNRGSGIQENDMDTDMLLARRADGIDIQLARKLQSDSGFHSGINRLDGLGSPSNPSPNVRQRWPPFHIF